MQDSFKPYNPPHKTPRKYIEFLDSDWQGTAFEGIGVVLESHRPVINFLYEQDAVYRPDDFLGLISSILAEDIDEEEDLIPHILEHDQITLPDVLVYIFDLLEFYKVSVQTLLREEDPSDYWEIYQEELHELDINAAVRRTIGNSFEEHFDTPITLFEAKMDTIKHLINLLSYQDNKPSVGEYFRYEVEENDEILGYIYGQITKEVEPPERIIETSYYEYDVLLYDSTVKDHELVSEPKSKLIQPAHSQNLTLMDSNPIM